MAKLYAPTLLLILLFSCFASNAQKLFKFKIRDKETMQVLTDVVVTDLKSNVKTSADAYGYTSIQLNDSSQYLDVSCQGYQSLTIDLTTYTADVIELARAPISLSTIVVTSTNHDNFVKKVAKSDITLRPVRSSQDILRVVPGLFIAQHAGGGKAEQIFLRGFDIDHGTDIQLSVDGLPVNMVSHGHGQGYADLHFLIPETVKEVEFGKGPYYADRGNLNTSGYVSFNTVDAVTDKLQLEAGSYNSARILGMVNLFPTANRSSAYVASELQYFDGPFSSPQKFNRFNVFGKYILRLKDDMKLTLSSSAFSSKWNASGQIPARAVESKLMGRFDGIDNTEGGYTGRYNASAKLSKEKANSGFELLGYYSRYYFNLYSNFTFFLRDSINGDQIKQSDERDIVGANARYHFTRKNNATTFKTVIGAGFRHDQTYDTELSYTNQRRLISNVRLGNITETNASFFVEEKVSVRKWQLNAGARIDQLYFRYADQLDKTTGSESKSIVTPKLNVQYSFSDRLKMFVKSGIGFHSNDTRVVVENRGQQILPRAYGTDLGIIAAPAKNFTLTAALWHLHMQQEFVYVGDEGIIEPSGRTQRYGIDVSARWQLSARLFADVDLNAGSAKFIDDEKGQDRVPLAPLITSTGGISFKSKSLSASMRYRYIGDRPANETNTIIAKGYLINDLSAEYSFRRYFIGMQIENLLNQQWNEAQFETTSRLRNEAEAVSELHFTPGTPLAFRLRVGITF
jgi:hypothetical protein